MDTKAKKDKENSLGYSKFSLRHIINRHKKQAHQNIEYLSLRNDNSFLKLIQGFLIASPKQINYKFWHTSLPIREKIDILDAQITLE